jgi:uncharacterized membrane protein YccC
MCCHQLIPTVEPAMTQSVSFRITRTAEDVAQTLNALAQRLVKLEQRLDSVDLQLRQQLKADAMAAEELERLDGVDLILQECQELLQVFEPEPVADPSDVSEGDDRALAA